MANKECCCYSCFRQKTCVGCNWYSDMCTKNRDECSLRRVRENFKEIKVGGIDDKRQSK